MVDIETGLQPDANTKKTIFESFKEKDNFIVDLEKSSITNTLGFNNKANLKKILRFY